LDEVKVNNIRMNERLDTKIIFVEGIAGSGKSTTGQLLYSNLHRYAYTVKLIHEFYSPHPIHELNTEEPKTWISKTLANWHNLADALVKTNEIMIMDGTLFQCTIGALLEMDVELTVILQYANQIPDILKSLNPILIYFYQDDVERAIRTAYEQREDNWRRRVNAFVSDARFFKNRRLCGLDGYIEYNRVLRNITDNLYSEYNLKKISIENSDGDWNHYHHIIAEFLSVPLIESDNVQYDDYLGVYRDGESARECLIWRNDNRLEISGYYTIPKYLILKERDNFFIQGKLMELVFRRNKSGLVDAMEIKGSNEKYDNKIWMKTE
jgi:uridine kinase